MDSAFTCQKIRYHNSGSEEDDLIRDGGDVTHCSYLLRAFIPHSLLIGPSQFYSVPTSIILNIPQGYYARIVALNEESNVKEKTLASGDYRLSVDIWSHSKTHIEVRQPIARLIIEKYTEHFLVKK